MRKNWMENFDRRNDEARERMLNNQLKDSLEILDELKDEQKRMKILEKIVEIYATLKTEACDIDEKDYLSKQKELVNLRYKKMQEKHKQETESQSWQEFQEEEQKYDKDR